MIMTMTMIMIMIVKGCQNFFNAWEANLPFTYVLLGVSSYNACVHEEAESVGSVRNLELHVCAALLKLSQIMIVYNCIYIYIYNTTQYSYNTNTNTIQYNIYIYTVYYSPSTMLNSQKLRFCHWGPEAEATLCTAFFPLHCPLQMATLRPDHKLVDQCGCAVPCRMRHTARLSPGATCNSVLNKVSVQQSSMSFVWCWKFETWALNYLPQFIRSHCLPAFRRSHGEESPHWTEHDPIPCFARFSLKLLCFLPSGCDIPLRSSSIAQAKDTKVAAEVHWWVMLEMLEAGQQRGSFGCTP
jgi:hypothetical protein